MFSCMQFYFNAQFLDSKTAQSCVILIKIVVKIRRKHSLQSTFKAWLTIILYFHTKISRNR